MYMNGFVFLSCDPVLHNLSDNGGDKLGWNKIKFFIVWTKMGKW